MKSYEYFNSKDMATYLEEQNYAFSPIEMAWLIYMCDRLTFKEKHTAWQELIKTTSDCEIPERMNCNYQPSLHEFLLKYMDVEDRSYEKFIKPDGYYSFSIKWKDEGTWEDGNVYCSSYESCWEKIREIIDVNLKLVERISILKYSMNQEDGFIGAQFSGSGELISIWDRTWSTESEENALLSVSFDGMWFDFPTPFKKGDILISNGKNYSNRPFVLQDIVTWDCNDWIRENGDHTDMCANGYFLNKDGSVFSENLVKYTDLEFYELKLWGRELILQIISKFMKGRIPLELFLNTYREIILKYCAEDS